MSDSSKKDGRPEGEKEHDESPGQSGSAAGEQASDTAGDLFSEALVRAQTGLRSEVRRLMDLMEVSLVWVPLAEDIPGVPENTEMEFTSDLTFRPHMLLDEDRRVFAVAYSDPDLVEPVREALDWETSGGALKFVHLPARIALDLSQETVDGHEVSGIVFNPSTDVELLLRRDEAAALLAGNALPLIGYVGELTDDGDPFEPTIVEGAEPPPAQLVDALDRAKAFISDLHSYRIDTTFHPERDREPHLTITLFVANPETDRDELATEVMERISELLPPPGYADIVFRDAPN